MIIEREPEDPLKASVDGAEYVTRAGSPLNK